MEELYFVFRLFDGANSGELSSKELSDLFQNMLTCPLNQYNLKQCQCPIFKEINDLNEKFCELNLKHFRHRKISFDFEFWAEDAKFYTLMVAEMRDKLL